MTSSVTPELVSDVLRRAAREVRNYGWTQGRLGNQRDGYCLVGAVRVAACLFSSRLPGALSGAALDRLKSKLPTPYAPDAFQSSLVQFNDAPGRTKEEVLDLLERTAAMEADR